MGLLFVVCCISVALYDCNFLFFYVITLGIIGGFDWGLGCA